MTTLAKRNVVACHTYPTLLQRVHLVPHLSAPRRISGHPRIAFDRQAMDVDEMNGVGQLQVHFVSKQAHLAVADTPYSIPAQVSIGDLNTLINSILRETVSEYLDLEFDFLIAGEFLRGHLGDHLRDRQISFEDVIEIEYVERFPAPEPQDCLLHDDWVSAVETRGKWILTGAYDNTVNLWTTKGEHKLTIPGHSSAVKAVAWIDLTETRGVFASGSQDQDAMIWEWDLEKNSVECVHVCKGHERGIDSMSVNPKGDKMATGSWDTMVKIWSTASGDAQGEGVRSGRDAKRAKTEQGSKRTPLMTLQGHRECVSGLQWLDNETLLSCSWDHTIKVWDLSLEGMKSEFTGNKSFFDVSFSKLNGLILTCSADKNVRLYDPRASQGAIVKQTYQGHQAWVQSIAWSKTHENLFISGAYDNQVKLWDSRSSKAPIYDLQGHEDKVLAVDWTNPEFIVSGGSDDSVRVFKSKKIQ